MRDAGEQVRYSQQPFRSVGICGFSRPSSYRHPQGVVREKERSFNPLYIRMNKKKLSRPLRASFGTAHRRGKSRGTTETKRERNNLI